MSTLIRDEKSLLPVIALTLAAFPLEHAILTAGQPASLAAAALLIAAILVTSQRVAHHAELLAIRFGEPYGTMLLTISAVLVEVVILAMMLLNSASPTLVRDTIYSAVMLDLNGILGLAAILGGLKYGEQAYNVDSGNSFVVMIMTALGVSMVVPQFLPAAHWQAYSVFTIIIMVVLYGLFLRVQTGQHSYFFNYAYGPAHDKREEGHDQAPIPVLRHALLLLSGIVLIGLLSEVMAKTLGAGLAGTGVPAIVPALIVALIPASPEILTALRAALNNRMQSVVNIALGASLSTVILTVPVIEGIALFTGTPIDMALTPVQTAMVLLTLLVASINLNDGETNVIEGLTHFVLFATFLMLAMLGV
ncbi:Ca2+:H+ antiporter [Fluviicoccus keumensis]|uniref:Ca2+:H+ antiporter n=1 Tax=Fluviicoccus keumensis TaxID=1435465 RepID=A0A4Q7YLI3_9GAMM|nr:calcium:proton antiporter [Fluviicoccus keumensis]RZU38552.1 Ca2+:H+ antiporter [Fluviicoccus keumensis]